MYTIQHGSTPVAMMINCACQFITMILCPAFINERVQIRIWDSLNGCYFGIHRGIQFKILIVPKVFVFINYLATLQVMYCPFPID